MRRSRRARIHWKKIKLLVAALSFLWPLLSPDVGIAHPLGNFSINQYSAIRIGREAVELRYIVDMAEIPTFQEFQENRITASPADGSARSYLATKVEDFLHQLELEANGRRLSFQARSQEISFPPGAGGLPTLKIGALYSAKLPESGDPAQYSLHYRDGNFAGRAGWKEIVVLTEPAINILNTSVPQSDRSAELGNYPTDLLNTPPQDLEARVTFTIPARIAHRASMESTAMRADQQTVGLDRIDQTGGVVKIESVKERRGDGALSAQTATSETVMSPSHSVKPNRQATPRDSFTELVAAPQLGWGIVLLAVAVALGLGAFHALEPGHGKTVVAAYLVGSKGTMKDAFLLGLIVTAAHTTGVYILGGVTLYASHYIVPERLYPWLGLLSATMIILTGVVLLIRYYRCKLRMHSYHHHRHGVGAHRHEHHGLEHLRGHRHMHLNRAPGTMSPHELLTLGISGGIVPCPAALVVLLSAVSMNRVGFGLLLILAFSAGLAVVLIAIGLLTVYTRRYMLRFQAEGNWVARWLPMTSSAFMVVLGAALMWQALQTTGLGPWGL